MSTPLCTGRYAQHPRIGRLPRRLQGRKTRRHAFLRSDGLSGLTDKDVQMLLDYGVCCVVDLRSESETAAAPSRLADVPGVDYYSIPMLDEAASPGLYGRNA